MGNAREPTLDDIRGLLQAALVLADKQDEVLIAIRIAEALDSVAARIDQSKLD